MGRDVSGQTALAVTTQSAYCDGDGGWGLCGALGPGGVGVGGAYCDCAQVVLGLWGRMIWKADCE